MSFATKITGTLSLFFGAAAASSATAAIANTATETPMIPPYILAIIGVACAATSSGFGVAWIKFGGVFPCDEPRRERSCCP